jgi:hypothetical protein
MLKPIYPEKRALGTHWIWDCVSLKVGVDIVAKKGTLTPAGIQTPAVQPLHRLKYAGSFTQSVERDSSK